MTKVSTEKRLYSLVTPTYFSYLLHSISQGLGRGAFNWRVFAHINWTILKVSSYYWTFSLNIHVLLAYCAYWVRYVHAHDGMCNQLVYTMNHKICPPKQKLNQSDHLCNRSLWFFYGSYFKHINFILKKLYGILLRVCCFLAKFNNMNSSPTQSAKCLESHCNQTELSLFDTRNSSWPYIDLGGQGGGPPLAEKIC